MNREREKVSFEVIGGVTNSPGADCLSPQTPSRITPHCILMYIVFALDPNEVLRL